LTSFYVCAIVLNMKQMAVFLDRDGTLNVEKGYIRVLEDLELIPGVAQAVRQMNDAELLVFLTTNQTGAARGFYDESHIHALNQRLSDLLQQEAGAVLNGVYYCPHLEKTGHPEFGIDCRCRKPHPGMIEQACKDFPNIDLAHSFVVGDKASDVAFGHGVGAKSILVKTGYGQRVLDGKYQSLDEIPEFVAESLVDGVDWILSQAVLSNADLAQA
jgi:D-glycero-D-manno-heptose 1,7-bisphosphate phosphatase